MQKLFLILLLSFKTVCFSIGTKAYPEVGSYHFSSPRMEKAFEEGMAWAKDGIVQKDLDKETPVDSEEGFFKCLKEANLEDPPLSKGLYIFISFSIPEETLKELSYGLEKTGGSFVIRGLPQNSFREFFEKTKHLKEMGILAPILVDPEAFERFGVQRVPTFVLKKGEHFEKSEGNIPLCEALRRFSEREKVGALAKELLQKGTHPLIKERYRVNLGPKKRSRSDE